MNNKKFENNKIYTINKEIGEFYEPKQDDKLLEDIDSSISFEEHQRTNRKKHEIKMELNWYKISEKLFFIVAIVCVIFIFLSIFIILPITHFPEEKLNGFFLWLHIYSKALIKSGGTAFTILITIIIGEFLRWGYDTMRPKDKDKIRDREDM